MEFAVGDSLQLGDCILTVVDIDGDEVSFRVDQFVPTGSAAPFAQEINFLPRK